MKEAVTQMEEMQKERTDTPMTTEKMHVRPRTKKDHKLYALRKITSEPVFGIIKRVMGFRQFLISGLANY